MSSISCLLTYDNQTPKTENIIAGPCLGPPQPKLGFMVGDKTRQQQKLRENRGNLSLNLGGPISHPRKKDHKMEVYVL